MSLFAPRNPSSQTIDVLVTHKTGTHDQALRRRNIIVPPLYFGMVAPKIYRRYPIYSKMLMNSGHPLQLNFPFLERLHLKTIMYAPFKFTLYKMLILDTSQIKSILKRTSLGARNTEYKYVTYACNLQKSRSPKMTLTLLQKLYHSSSIRETIQS